MPMRDAMESVRAFHDKMNVPQQRTPTLIPGDRRLAQDFAERLSSLSFQALGVGTLEGDLLLLRLSLALEELSEWLAAHANGDLVAAADAWADRAYVLFGDAVAAGLPASALFEAVHASNMSKSQTSLAGGKALKGPGYFRPDIAEILKHSGRR